MSTYGLRKPFVLLEAFLVPSVGAVLLLLTVRPLKLALAAVLVLLAIGAWGLVRVSRRTLTVTDEGMQLQRDKYRLTAPWDAVEAVHRGRRRGLVKADELILADSWIVAIDHAGRTTALPKGVEGHPAPRRVQVSLYERDWPSGPIGQHLRARGITIWPLPLLWRLALAAWNTMVAACQNATQDFCFCRWESGYALGPALIRPPRQRWKRRRGDSSAPRHIPDRRRGWHAMPPGDDELDYPSDPGKATTPDEAIETIGDAQELLGAARQLIPRLGLF